MTGVLNFDLLMSLVDMFRLSLLE